VGLVAPTTVVEGDVDGGPLERCCRRVWQRPPPLLKETSMAPPPWEVLPVSPAAPTIIVGEDVDGGPLGGAVGGLSSAHHRC
jgi:hypothetical protein